MKCQKYEKKKRKVRIKKNIKRKCEKEIKKKEK